MLQTGGPYWELPLGRRDSRAASLSGSNTNIPPPNSTIQNLITFFKRQGLNEVDLVALSGKRNIVGNGFLLFLANCASKHWEFDVSAKFCHLYIWTYKLYNKTHELWFIIIKYITFYLPNIKININIRLFGLKLNRMK